MKLTLELGKNVVRESKSSALVLMGKPRSVAGLDSGILDFWKSCSRIKTASFVGEGVLAPIMEGLQAVVLGNGALKGPDDWRGQAAKALDFLDRTPAEEAIFVVPLGSLEDLRWFVEGLGLAHYRHEVNFSKPRLRALRHGRIVIPGSMSLASARDVLVRAQVMMEGTDLCRDLVNTPAADLVPMDFAERARGVGVSLGLGVTVWDKDELERRGCQGLLGVGRGSVHPPAMVILEYRPQGRAGVIEEGGKAGKAVLSVKKKGGKSGPHLALVGKGVCFDTGGISIKPAGDMWRMKGDMAGAGAVLGAMMAIAKLKPSIPVTGILVLALNAVDAHSLLPGDVLRARNGKTIHVDNTDAEGRLILTDGLYEAKERGATHCVDVATLTGACSRALGPALAGLFSNDDGLAEELLRAGQAHGEGFWRLPLVEEYRSMLKTDNADLNNVGGPTAGAITAALFLEEFVAPGMKWAHLDIAGTGLPGKPRTGMAPGATGFATRTLAALALALGPGDAA